MSMQKASGVHDSTLTVFVYFWHLQTEVCQPRLTFSFLGIALVTPCCRRSLSYRMIAILGNSKGVLLDNIWRSSKSHKNHSVQYDSLDHTPMGVCVARGGNEYYVCITCIYSSGNDVLVLFQTRFVCARMLFSSAKLASWRSWEIICSIIMCRSYIFFLPFSVCAWQAPQKEELGNGFGIAKLG